MPDITTLFPMDSTFEGTPSTPNMSAFFFNNADTRTPTPTLDTTGLDMVVYKIPDEKTTTAITLCNRLLSQIDTTKTEEEDGETYNNNLCDALLDTIETATLELEGKTDTDCEENPIPCKILHSPTSKSPNAHNNHYEDISSPDVSPAKNSEHVTNLTIIDTNQEDSASSVPEMITTDLNPRPMFSYLIPTNTTQNSSLFSRLHLVTTTSPRTWCHVDEGGSMIEVTENNMQTQSIPPQEHRTPLQDERQTPPQTPAGALKATPRGDNTPKPSFDMGTMTINNTRDIGCNPQPIINTQDQHTNTAQTPKKDTACSPIRANTVDQGTDPIAWWMEDTRNFLAK
jgi:hypothetical protein